MRVLVTGAGGFVGAHVDFELQRAGYERVDVALVGSRSRSLALARNEHVDAVIHLTPAEVRHVLDLAWVAGAKTVVYLSALGADPRSPRPELASRGRAEEMIRASGLPWVIVRPEIIWGPGDVFTNELAHLLRHLAFVPVPRKGPLLAPVHVGDVARTLVDVIGRPALERQVWTLPGPEQMDYAAVVERIAEAIGRAGRPHLRVPDWSVRIGAALEEWMARRPRITRTLIDSLVGWRGHEALLHEHDIPEPTRHMTAAALRDYLEPAVSVEEQVGRAVPVG